MLLTIRVVCSKGTYLRALARDIGQSLGSGAHLAALRRTRVGDYSIDDCLDIDGAMTDIVESEIEVSLPDSKEPFIIAPAKYTPSSPSNTHISKVNSPRNIKIHSSHETLTV